MKCYYKQLTTVTYCLMSLFFVLDKQTSLADTTTGFLIRNPWLDDTTSGNLFLDDPDGVHWSINPEWELEPFVFDGALMFPTRATNLIGRNTAEASAVNLTAETNVTTLAGYNPSTTKLTDLIFHDPWRVGHYGAVPQNGQYDYFIEFTIETLAGNYRASTQKLDRTAVMQNTIAQVGFVFNWETVGFLGNPFAGNGGIALDQITNIDYDVIMETIVPTTTVDQFGDTGFFNVEGFNVQYEVSTASASFAADFDNDGDVDSDDLNVWQASYALDADGDADDDLDSDGRDFLIWQREYGSGISLLASAINVPEPSSLVLLIAGLQSINSLLRRRAYMNI